MRHKVATQQVRGDNTANTIPITALMARLTPALTATSFISTPESSSSLVELVVSVDELSVAVFAGAVVLVEVVVGVVAVLLS